ncbi:hypothetical protein CERSUDRAFT_162949 [Gelatoporia subvermispora B]|uniref:Uncharacterized protein n=1 Tax=Ceriporiopsis subvermispora (strain B) TaxID=914234 RepID=M2QZV7_CERS8|nr:hypothetical protein CERSUDRAFT_162949 [Gelatoporia subvermispora B]
MISSFPTPILSVAADVVKDLEGDEALCSLWALFTKCKESLKDGRRLENISWRLWYRELAAAQISPVSTPSSESSVFSGIRSPSPVTPISESGQQDPSDTPTRPSLKAPAILPSHSWHGAPPTSALAAGRRLSTASVPTARSRSRPNNVGQQILDILPGSPLDMPQNKAASSAPRDATRPGAVSPAAPSLAQPRPVMALPTVQLPRTPPQEPASFRVVVVNPTPHPTPPATPHIPRMSTPLTSARASSHLQPPPSQALLAAPTLASPAHATTSTAATSTRAPAPLPGAPAEILQASPALSRASHAPPNRSHDDTLRASDRRFFLPEGSPEVHSPDSTGARIDTGKDPAENGHARSPSSVTSSMSVVSNVKSEGAGPAGGARRPASRTGFRKSREPARHGAHGALGAHHAPARQGIHRIHPLTQRPGLVRKNTSGKEKKDTFTVGSTSSNGSRSAVAGPSNGKAPAKDAAQKEKGLKDAGAHKPHRASPPKRAQEPAQPAQPARRGIVLESSDYETTDSDDDSDWASEENVPDEAAKERAREEARIHEAAEEAQRQRDMFAKMPRRSYSNLNRTRSGLLSQLLNPDPNLFPPNHPYRTSYSSQDMTQLARGGSGFSSALAMSKSSAAVPLAAQVTAQAPPTDGAPAQTSQQKPDGPYRPKARPQGQELEDSSDSEDESPENAIQVSRSLAQQKLAALADPARRRNSDRAAHPPPAPTPAPARGPEQRPQLTTVATAPIPLAHPYNLPAPAAPMTPRTTRRQMLATELSESLRRQLLWERQVSKINMTGARRPSVLGNGIRPLTAANGEAATAGPAGLPGGRPGETDEERRQRAQRNRSWADDYHYAGW